ncbi:uncharacterized protein METZ01_LOCUS508725 [marine metagenome]|uniref:Uncharacterized protein n=1 Tax=marine metagenome TaxID=408172 RepID=A0A383EGJ6_9ZZZZ
MIAKQGLPRFIAIAGLTMALILPLATPTAAAEGSPQNAVELRVSDVEFEEAGRYGQFTYTREFHDLSGHGAKIRHGRVCYSSGGCISAPLEYIVEPGGVLVQEGQLLMPMSISQAFDFTYIGEDGEGGDVTVRARILVVGAQLELQELE